MMDPWQIKFLPRHRGLISTRRQEMLQQRETVVRVYKGFGDRPGTPIRGQVIDRSRDKGSGDNPVTPAAAGD